MYCDSPSPCLQLRSRVKAFWNLGIEMAGPARRKDPYLAQGGLSVSSIRDVGAAPRVFGISLDECGFYL